MQNLFISFVKFREYDSRVMYESGPRGGDYEFESRGGRKDSRSSAEGGSERDDPYRGGPPGWGRRYSDNESGGDPEGRLRRESERSGGSRDPMEGVRVLQREPRPTPPPQVEAPAAPADPAEGSRQRTRGGKPPDK